MNALIESIDLLKEGNCRQYNFAFPFFNTNNTDNVLLENLYLMEAIMDFETVVFGLITNSGDARSCAMEALKEARLGHFEQAEALLKEADEKLLEAHKTQTALIQAEASGNPVEVNILMIHAQDHLMNAITVKDLAYEIVALSKSIKAER